MLKLILVDENREDLLLAERVLRQCKLLNPIQLCQSTSECLDHLCLNGQNDDYAVVLINVVVHSDTGLQLLRQISESKRAGQIITVMISGLSDIKAINEGYQLGAKTFLLKPVNRDDVVQVLNSLSDRVLIEQAANGYRLHHVEENTGQMGREVPALSFSK